MVITVKSGDTKELLKAFESVKKTRESSSEHIDIVFEGGEYCLSEPIVITKEMNDFSVCADENNKARIRGGEVINGFYGTTFRGVPCFAAKVTRTDFTDLFVDGLRADFTRYPESGFLHAVSVEDERCDILDAGSSYAYLKTEDLAEVTDIEDAIISYCHFWIDEHTPVKSFDRNTGKLEFKYRSRFSIAKNTAGDWNEDFNYYVENTFVTFKNPNEWYLDHSAGIVYYIPRNDSQTPENIVAVAPATDRILKFAGNADEKCNNISFENIIFSDTKGDYGSHCDLFGNDVGICYASDPQAVALAHGSFDFEYAEKISFNGCEFLNLGVHALDIRKGCSDVCIENCRFYDLGAGAVRISGGASSSAAFDLTHHITVKNCVINHCGRRYLSACGIIILNGYDNLISRNEISDLYYTGISCGWVWGYSSSVTRGNIIEYNHICNLGQGRLSDMGGIYTLGKQPGTIVRGNLIHDIKSYSYGGWALYADEGSSDEIWEDNICYNTSDNSFDQHYGKKNTVRNNIFAFCKKEPIRVTRNEDHLSGTFENNIVYAKGTPFFKVWEEQISKCRVKSKNNTFYFEEGTVPQISLYDGFKTLEEVTSCGFDDGSEFKIADDKQIEMIINDRKKDLGFI